MKHWANLITTARMIAAPCLLLTEPLSPGFYAVFIFCGVTDVADGMVARRTHTESRTGAVLDSIADMVFLFVSLFKILPLLRLPLFLWLWIGGIALVKITNLISGYLYQRKFTMPHTAANKATGLALFSLPFLIGRVHHTPLAVLLCLAATFAAIEEGRLIRTGRAQ